MTERVVVIGAGFAGVEVAKGLGAAGVPVTLVDKQNSRRLVVTIEQIQQSIAINLHTADVEAI